MEAMASAVHQNCHRLLTLLLRPLPAPAPHPRVSFSPRPAGVRSFFPAPGCRLGTDAVALAEPELVPPEEEDDGTRFVVVTFYKFLPLEDPRAEVASHLHFLQVLLPSSLPPVRSPSNLPHCKMVLGPHGHLYPQVISLFCALFSHLFLDWETDGDALTYTFL